MDKRNRYGYLEGIIGMVANLLLFGLKHWAGIVSGSIALIADAWHTFSDSASSVIVVGSVKLSSRKADQKHPFGHGRIQEIASLFIAFMLGIVAYEFLTDSITKFRDHESTQFGTLAIVITAISIAVKEGMAQFAYWAYRKTGLDTLKADGWHHRSDALSSAAILIGILLGDRFWWMDSLLGILISLMLFYAVYEIIRSSVDKLLGERPNEKLITDVKKLISRISEKEICPHHFHIHSYGEHKELTLHIMLDGELDIESGHQIATKIEVALRKEMGIEATIHVEPYPAE